jgi:apolipoprotein N-acyltransferase
MQEGKKITAAVLQGNFSSAEKWTSDVDMLETYATLAKEAAAEGATLILWPETAIPYGLTGDTYARTFLSRLAEDTRTTQVVGAFSYEVGETDERVRRNSLFLFRPDGTVSGDLYHKRHLVPFGEYVPMAWLVDTLLPALGSLEMLNDGSRMTAGDDPALFEEDWGRLGGLICFDSIYPALARDSAAAGAELLLISTNDSWFFDSRAVYQHNGQAILRAIENGRYVLRSANTGISSIITAKGEVIGDIPALTRGQLTAEVALVEGNTLYTQIGDLFVLLAAIAFHLPFAAELCCRIREKKKKV